MLIYYNPASLGVSSCYKKILLRVLLLLFTGFSAQLAVAQTEPATDQTIAGLLQQRNTLISGNESTRELDQQLYQLGHRPKAVISSQTLENGNLRVSFPFYLAIDEARKDRIVQRLTTYYSSYLYSLDISLISQEIILNLAPGTSGESIDAIVDHFGYLGHE